MIIRIWKCRGGIDQAKVIWGKSVTYFSRTRVEGVALNAILHAD